MTELINNFYVGNLLYILFILIVGVSILNPKTKNFKYIINYKQINFIFLIKIICLSLVIRILIEELLFLLIPQNQTTIIEINYLKILVTFISNCVFAPVFEEIMCRYGIYKSFNKKLNPILSIIITSIIFTLIHLYNITGFVSLFIASLIWNYSYYKTDNLLYPITLHFVYNLYAFIFNLYPNKLLIIILAIICIVIYIILNIKNSSKNTAKK